MNIKCPLSLRNAAAFLILILAFTANNYAQPCDYTWQSQTSGTTALLYSVKTVSSTVGWAAGAGAVVRRTTDGGTTWGNGNPNPGVIVGDIYNIEAIDANTAWVTTSGASTFIYKTTNGGANWIQVYAQVGGFINGMKMISAVNGYAFGDPVAGVWTILTTIDGGTTWTQLPTAPVAATEDGRNNCMQVSLPDIWYGTGQNKVYHSSNAGLTWSSAVTTGITGQVTGLQFNSNLVGLVGGATMSKTTDGGTTFALLAAPGTGTISGIKGTGNDYWFVRGTSIYRSTDVGVSWLSVHTQTAAQNDISLVNDGGCLTGWSAGTTGTISKMTGTPVIVSCNFAWVNQTSTTTALLYSVKAVSNTVGWTAGAGAVVRKTTDGGITWVDGNPNPGVIVGDIYNIEAIDANTAWVTTSSTTTFIYKTTNGGVNWVQVYSQAGGFINGIKMVTAVNGYAFGDPVASVWTILTTVDGGTTWTQLPTAPAAGAEDGRNNCMQVSLPDIWYGTGQNKVYHSSNSGATWTNSVTTGITGQVAGIQFNTNMVGLVGGATMSKTTDGGTTWSLLAVPGSGTISGIEGSGSDYWFVRGTGIYRTTDVGVTWNQVHTQTAAQNDISLVLDGSGCVTGWAAGTTGTAAKMSGIPVGINDPTSEFPTSYKLEQNYPNPFNPTTNITFALPMAGNVELKIYDILGKEVATLVNTFKNSGTHIVPFDASALSSGIYIYKITAGDFADSKKMVLIK